jgi:hypothetical protein
VVKLRISFLHLAPVTGDVGHNRHLVEEAVRLAAAEGADWVMVSDETPIDEQGRDELLQAFQTHYHAGDARSLTATGSELDEAGDDEMDDQEIGRE